MALNGRKKNPANLVGDYEVETNWKIDLYCAASGARKARKMCEKQLKVGLKRLV